MVIPIPLMSHTPEDTCHKRLCDGAHMSAYHLLSTGVEENCERNRRVSIVYAGGVFFFSQNVTVHVDYTYGIYTKST